MKIVRTPFLILLLLASISCQPKNKSGKQEVAQKEESDTHLETKLTSEQLQEYETAYFASGCFWCVEAIFESVKGVKEVYSGYSGGSEKNPTYEQVSYGRTHHAEAVEVYYDPDVISFMQLVQVFLAPTTQPPLTGKDLTVVHNTVPSLFIKTIRKKDHSRLY